MKPIQHTPIYAAVAAGLIVVVALLAPGCTGAEIAKLSAELDRAGAEIAAIEAGIDEIKGAIESGIEAAIDEIRASIDTMTPEQRAQAEPYLAALMAKHAEVQARAEPYLVTLAQTLAEVQARADGIGQRLAELETTEGKSAGNFLLAAGEIAASFGGLLPPPFGALVLAAGTAAGGIGTALNRRIAAELVGSIELAKAVVTPQSPNGTVNFADPTTKSVIRQQQSAATRWFVDRVQDKRRAKAPVPVGPVVSA